MTTLTKTRTIRVVGMTFVDGYPDNLHTLARIDAEITAAGSSEGCPVVLFRRPNNPADPNAVEVHAPTVGMIGHIPRDLAATLAPLLDDGIRFRCYVNHIRIDPDHPDRPGVDITVARIIEP